MGKEDGEERNKCRKEACRGSERIERNRLKRRGNGRGTNTEKERVKVRKEMDKE